MQVMISKKCVFLSLKIDFDLANSADPDVCRSTHSGVTGLREGKKHFREKKYIAKNNPLTMNN